MDRTDDLHQQASARYLQGDFDSALGLWRELLNLDPGDQRALEGVRLCELLARQARGDSEAVEPPVEVATPPVVSPAAPPSAAAQPDL